MKYKKFISSTAACVIATMCLSVLSASAAESPTVEMGFTPLAPEGWNESITAQKIYGNAEQEPMISNTPLAPEGWNDSTAVKLLYGDAEEEVVTVYGSIIVSPYMYILMMAI